MGHEETVEQFMRRFFRARTSTFEAIAKVRQPFRQQYYDTECAWGSHCGEVERSESEQLLRIGGSSNATLVETSGFGPPSKRTRYHISLAAEGRLIYQVDIQCDHIYAALAGGDSADCFDCGGTGWLNWNRFLQRLPAVNGKPPAVLQRSAKEGASCDPEVVNFMNAHFRVRAAIRQSELHLYSGFANRFYSPDCDQPRSGYSARKTEVETVVDTKVAPTWARVITRSSGDVRESWLRYSLRRVGETWLIVQVDLEASGSPPQR